MKIDDEIIVALARKLSESLARRTICYLQSRTDCNLSGGDSGLKNIWEEICVQVQYERSVLWDTYDETVKSIVSGYFDDLDDYEKIAIWLCTSSGCEWISENESSGIEDCDFDSEDAVDHIVSEHVYNKASSWSNERIRNYLEV